MYKRQTVFNQGDTLEDVKAKVAQELLAIERALSAETQPGEGVEAYVVGGSLIIRNLKAIAVNTTNGLIARNPGSGVLELDVTLPA